MSLPCFELWVYMITDVNVTYVGGMSEGVAGHLRVSGHLGAHFRFYELAEMHKLDEPHEA